MGPPTQPVVVFRPGRRGGRLPSLIQARRGDPANSGFGYFTMTLTNLPGPAGSFALDNVFVRSSFPQNGVIPFGVSSITYTHWGNQP